MSHLVNESLAKFLSCIFAASLFSAKYLRCVLLFSPDIFFIIFQTVFWSYYLVLSQSFTRLIFRLILFFVLLWPDYFYIGLGFLFFRALCWVLTASLHFSLNHSLFGLDVKLYFGMLSSASSSSVLMK